VESDLLGLDFSVLDINFVSNENDWNLLTYSSEIFVPFVDILVSDTGANIKHDDSTVSSNIVSVSQSSKFLLTCSVPNIE